MTEVRPTLIPPGARLPEAEKPQVSSQTVAVENPMEGGMSPSVTGVRGGANMYGAFSIETFCDQGALNYTHEDAEGWLRYVTQFTPANFWYKDCGVRAWAYYEDYDNWQATYGMDAVCAVYHSGHGGMDGNGVFYAPMGCDWGGLGCTAISSNMFLGNEHAKYIFWSTCLSLRVLGGHNPIRTWGHSPNPGWRMIFGFETTSWDSPDYGKFFWEEWRKGKSFSTAWLDASWRIAHDMAPSVVACGATAEEAQNRLFNERYFICSPVSHNWYSWRWYYASTAAREPQLSLPQNLLLARLQPVAARLSARALADRFQIEMKTSDEVAAAPDGSFRIAEGEKSIAYGGDGSLEVRLAKPNLANRTQLATQRATPVAQEAVRRYGLDQQAPLVFDRVLFSSEAGGTANGSGQIEGPYTTGTVVQFRQLINGVPVITPGAGIVRIAIDNDGMVTNVQSSVRAIEQLSNRPMSTTGVPTPEGVTVPPQGPEPTNYEQMLAAEFSKLLTSWVVKGGGRMPLGFTTVPGSTEIGYDIRGDEAVLIARKAVEVDFGNGYRKRYWVTTPLFE